MESELKGIVNGHIVDEHLYRGGDVSLIGTATLVTLKIKRVICLLNAKQDSVDAIITERNRIETVGIGWAHVPMESGGFWSYKDIDQVPSVLKLIEEIQGSVLVHCHEGKDRSSVVCAMYRVMHGMSVDDAIKEGEKYGWHWWNRGMKAEVRKFFRKNPVGND